MKALIAVLFTVTMSSCIFEYYDENDEPNRHENHLMVLHINPLDRIATEDDEIKTTEMVKSLRIIVLSDDAVEFNRYVDLGRTPEGIKITDLNYMFSAYTVEGRKSFYLIANEESVGEMTFLTNEQPSDEDVTGTLHDYLENIVPDLTDFEAGQKLAQVLNSVYFRPQYSADGSGNIYLPYSSYYDGYTIEADTPTNIDDALEMYLVPVATKFMFRFVNYRTNPVEINNITISSTNPDNFLYARVNYPDDSKTFEGEDYYWVDWLAKVSEASHSYVNFGDNITFNEVFGWISHYDMPDLELTQNSNFVNSSNIKTVKAGEVDPESEEITPSVLTLGPFYAPESWNSYTYLDATTGQNVTTQRYGMTLGIHDTSSSSGRDPSFDNIAIDNLKALFRNTCVLIKVKMNEGQVEVYAEINPWNIKTANGWLTEGDAPSNNPF